MSSTTESESRRASAATREVERVRPTIALGHEQAEDALGPERLAAEERDQARVDAAGEADDRAAALEVVVDDPDRAGARRSRRRPGLREESATRRQSLTGAIRAAVFSPTKRVMLAIESRFSGRTSSSAISTS